MFNTATVIVIVAVLLTSVAAWRLGRVWLKYRGKRVISCPENHIPAGVSLDVRHAVASAFRGDPELRLAACSRWPERGGCGQDCLFQIEQSPEDCLVRNILVQWYKDKNCVWCGRPIGEIQLGEHKPTVLSADKHSVEWRQIPAEQLPQTLATGLPLCYGCHLANTMVREHPELVIDRGRQAVAEK
jgi:hypothetical protein